MFHQALESKLPQVKQIFKQHKVKRAYAFGSVCTDQFNDKSDIDFLIAFEDNLDPLIYGESYWTLLDELPLILNRSVDIVTERSMRNPYFISEVNKTKTSIYE